MTDWPAALPQDALLAGFADELVDNTVRSSMTYGPDKVRRRTTAVIRHVTVPLILTRAELATLETFYLTTLQSTGSFDWKDHVTQAAETYRFRSPPKRTAIHGDMWTVQLELETVP